MHALVCGSLGCCHYQSLSSKQTGSRPRGLEKPAPPLHPPAPSPLLRNLDVQGIFLLCLPLQASLWADLDALEGWGVVLPTTLRGTLLAAWSPDNARIVPSCTWKPCFPFLKSTFHFSESYGPQNIWIFVNRVATCASGVFSPSEFFETLQCLLHRHDSLAGLYLSTS